MCLTAPARLVSAEDGIGIVEIGGRRRRASLLLMPDAAPGDWLLVGAGNALRRLDATEAEELMDLIATATAAAGSMPPTGDPR